MKLTLIPDNAIPKACDYCKRPIYLFENKVGEYKPYEEHPQHKGRAVPHISQHIGKRIICHAVKLEPKLNTPLFD